MLQSQHISLPKIILYIGMILGAWGVGYLSMRYGILAGAALAVIPCLLGIFYLTVNNLGWSLVGLFVINYFLMALARYMPDAPSGIVLDVMITYNAMLLLFHAIYQRIEWGSAKTGLTLVAVIWTLYGTLQLFNPESVSVSGWFSSVRSTCYYFLGIVLLSQLIFKEYKWLRYILFTWSILTLIAVVKCLIQKYYGFNNMELYWLYVLGGARTHVIHSGVRYFSFFSDAANFGASMGLSMVVFSIAALYFKAWKVKIYLLFIAALACYSMLLSGTRSALAVPFVGYVLFIILSKNWRVVLGVGLVILSIFLLLNFTYIGQGNAIIRRTRSAFNIKDASLMVRLENQKQLRELMSDKPFGAGLGHGGGKAKVFAPDAPISQIPTDSWFVMIWVETGLVGILLHLTILCYVLLRGCYLVMFRLRNPQLRGLIGALISGIAGILVASYGNEIFGQIPTGVIMYTSMAFIFLSPRFDRELTAKQLMSHD